MEVENPHITNCSLVTASPETIHGNIQLAPILSVGAASLKLSSFMDCKSGMTLISWHTSVSSDAVRSLSSLFLSIGKPPLLQERGA